MAIKAWTLTRVRSAPAFDLDHDTKGTTDHQHIASDIRRKICTCEVFLAELTHVVSYTTADQRPRKTPNPNVTIELGMAIRSQGFGRLILVMNEAYGGPDDLPFDLKSHSCPITYNWVQSAEKEAIRSTTETVARSIGDKARPMMQSIIEEELARQNNIA